MGYVNGRLIDIYFPTFLDLREAFETVNHSIVFYNLSHYGIQNSHMNWFKSCLSKRKQRVFVNGVNSTTTNISSGVPQRVNFRTSTIFDLYK